MTPCSNSINSSLFRMEDGRAQIEELEKHLDENPDNEELIEQVFTLLDLGLEGLPSEEAGLLERDIEEITQEIAAEEELEEEPLLEAPAIPETKKKKKKHHSKGFFKKVARKVAHAVRDSGRFVRKIGSSDKKCLHSHRVEHLDGSHHKSSHSHHIGRKVAKFFKKHKKALIIGAVVATVVVTAAILIPSLTATSVTGTGIAVGKALSGSKDVPSPKAKPKPPKDFTFQKIMNPDLFLHEGSMKQAEEKAKEQRYPGLVFPERDVQQARLRADEAFDRFKSELPHALTGEDLVKTSAIVSGVAGTVIAAGSGNVVIGATTAISTAALAKDLAVSLGDRASELYRPVAQSYSALFEMESANRQASASRCEKEGYQPKLEFNLTAPMTHPEKTVFIDRNNPNPNNQISVVMP